MTDDEPQPPLPAQPAPVPVVPRVRPQREKRAPFLPDDHVPAKPRLSPKE